MQMAQDVGIQADQTLVGNVLTVIDDLLQHEQDGIDAETQAENQRVEEYTLQSLTSTIKSVMLKVKSPPQIKISKLLPTILMTPKITSPPGPNKFLTYKVSSTNSKTNAMLILLTSKIQSKNQTELLISSNKLSLSSKVNPSKTSSPFSMTLAQMTVSEVLKALEININHPLKLSLQSTCCI
uniref:Initiation and co-stimulation factor-A n=1 Tax=Tetrahymena thermophila TaxID=5911 RepID=Q27202_TETTH|nr:Initiation and co-stimulation factor-A [Tetrahymena thermophila]